MKRLPVAIDVVVVLLVVALSALALTARQAPVARDWVAVLALAVPLLWRRRAPVVVFWTIAATILVLTKADIDSPAMLFAPLIAIFAVARYRSRRQLWPAAGGIAASLLASRYQGEMDWAGVAAISASAAATVLLGINLKTRQAYLAELEERARRLERERDQQAQLATAAERARIAREMHDIVAHNLAVIVALADGAAAAPARASELMQQVSVTGRQALGEMRRLVGLLRDGSEPARGPQPGLDDIDQLVGQVRAAGVQVELTQEGVAGSWGPGAGLALYRIVQEALTNTLKHAGPAAAARVRLRYTGDGAEVEVVDDGGGQAAVVEARGNHHGLAGMRERASSYGGRIEAGPLPGAGWRVHAHLSFK